MKKLINYILGYLLHHANKEPHNNWEGKDFLFYDTKTVILKKFATQLESDLQFIKGKECFSCNGTGQYLRNRNGYDKLVDCYNCGGTGMYKDNFYTILDKYQLGSYTFHVPKEKLYSKPLDKEVTVNGYIEHKASKYGYIANFLVMLLFCKGYLKHRYENARGLKSPILKHRNWLHNFLHIISRRGNSIPIRQLKDCFKPKPKPKPKQNNTKSVYDTECPPF